MPLGQPPIAIVSTAARYPDAADVKSLWANVLEGRRAFRQIPPERLDLAAYASFGWDALKIAPVKAGLITNWRFDRARFLIPGAAYEATDLAHWLALDVAADALGPLDGLVGLDRSRIAVIVANTLTGEFSRATSLALRAPFLDDLLGETARSIGMTDEQCDGLRLGFVQALRDRLSEPNEETLAGALANTIAGRIANYFDLRGGAFTVDAACASSLVAMGQAADLLATGRVDCVIVGAVDLSLDPFELVGFSRVGALASDQMRVFDARSSGFWPGEGAGFAVLMRDDTARAAGFEVLATLRGWGISTDGAGGLIRPTVAGQVLAVERACEGAGVDPRDLAYVEAHGTGTPTGDPVEVRALATLRQGAVAPLPIGSIKANIGHTKAAAGLAGVIKTVESLRHGVIAPHVGFETAHPVFAEVDNRVRVADAAELFADDRAVLAGVSSFGFGGVNAHVILERAARDSLVRGVLPALQRTQDAELFLFAAPDRERLDGRLERLRRRAGNLAWSELADAAGAVAAEVGEGPFRAAVVARDLDELIERLDAARVALAADVDCLEREHGVFYAARSARPRIGFLFPGQAAPVRVGGGLWARRFGDAAAGAPGLETGASAPSTDTSSAQPAIAAASLAALRVLARCGVTAEVGLGHSLGEVTALAWAGVIDLDGLVALAGDRGRACADHAEPGGLMVRVNADAETARSLTGGLGVVVACENGARETVVSGPPRAAREFARLARKAAYETIELPVSHAFHSPMMRGAVEPWRRRLETLELGRPRALVISTVTGAPITDDDDLRALLVRQLEEPVRFLSGLRQLEGKVDLLIEVGPGRGTARLAREAGVRAVSTDAFGASLAPLCEAIAAAFVLGAPVDPLALTRDRRLRPLDLDRGPELLANPCGRRGEGRERAPPSRAVARDQPVGATMATDGASLVDLVRRIVAAELRLDVEAVGPDDRFDTRLNLESLAVARIVARAARAANAPMPRAPTEFASSNSRQLADALREMRDMPGAGRGFAERVDGVEPWIRTYAMSWRPAPEIRRVADMRWQTLPVGPAPPQVFETAALIDASGASSDDAMQDLIGCIQHVAAAAQVRHLAILGAGAPLSAMARTVALEGRFESVRLIDNRTGGAVDLEPELAAEADGYAEVRLAPDGRRLAPVFMPTAPSVRPARPLDASDVVLVVGGARGIAAECALRLAERTGCGLILCGRSDPDAESVAAVLERAAASGLQACYMQADVLDPAAFALALEAAKDDVGAPTILIHAPGANTPMRLSSLTPDIVKLTLDTKVAGLGNALAAAGETLERVYAFGSIIGRLGLEGEAHYALANAWQTELLARFAEARPDCLALSVEWSVWGGVGMGERLGALERLAASGVDALGLDDALDAFEDLVASGAAGDIVVTSRFGPPPFIDLAAPQLTPQRFVDRVLAHYPGVELVCETQLWVGRDPYLADHRIQDEMTMPGVMALEAMAQVARQVSPRLDPSTITDVAFLSALSVPEGGALRIRICALRRADGAVVACIKAADDGFVAVRMRATFGGCAAGQRERLAPAPPAEGGDATPLYGPLFFHGLRFRRLASYRVASSRAVVARLAAAPAEWWFSVSDLPDLVLGDPGARDAALHALQAAVPYRQVIPASVDQITFHPGGAPVEVSARETAAEAGRYTFDIFLTDAAGDIVEVWRGAHFRSVGLLDVEAALRAAPWLAPVHLERLCREALSDPSVVVALGQSSPAGRAQQRTAILGQLGMDDAPRRGDGRPVRSGLSLSHGGDGLGVRSALRIGCDVERVSAFSEPAEAPPMLVQTADGLAIASADAWVIGEALRKLGRRPPFRVGVAERGELPPCARLYAAGDALVLVTGAPSDAGPVLVAVAVAAQRARSAPHEDLELSHGG